MIFMLSKIFKSRLTRILTRYLSISILGIICIPFDLTFAKLISNIFSNQFLVDNNKFDLNILGEYDINFFNIIFLLLFFGIIPVLIRAFFSL